MPYISDIQLTNFRNYAQSGFNGLSDGFVVLYGENGAGKTNILEAVSLLCPGRGLRGAKITEIQNNQLPQPWAVSAKAVTDYGDVRLGTGRDGASDKRLIRINGETAKSQNHLGEYISCLWLTPQMDGLFTGGASDRRRFFDRLIAAYDASHNGRLGRYENALRQRTKVLIDDKNTPDPDWLSALEKTIAETGVALAAARLDFIERLNKVTANLHQTHATGDFPQASFVLVGEVEAWLESMSALETEDKFTQKLEAMRIADTQTKTANFGVHKCDIQTTHLDKNSDAGQCSTGEQKALLTGIILAHRHMLAKAKTQMPLLLLDEVAAHFDLKRRSSLFEFLQELGGQIWMTGTDKNLFDPILNDDLKYQVKMGDITKCG